MLEVLFGISALLVAGQWLRELWQERQQPGEKPNDPIPGKNTNDNRERAEQFPKALYAKQEDMKWRIDMVLVLLLLLGAIALGGK